MKRIAALSLVSIFAVSATMAQTERVNPEGHADSQMKAPDNTSKNRRDAVDGKVTAQDQSNAKSDTDITIALRKEIMAAKGLSSDAKNVKIITENGVLTLRGPVSSAAEKEQIGAMAKSCAGVRKYSNQLEVKGLTGQKTE
jgi:hyperosmotically inducible protein